MLVFFQNEKEKKQIAKENLGQVYERRERLVDLIAASGNTMKEASKRIRGSEGLDLRLDGTRDDVELGLSIQMEKAIKALEENLTVGPVPSTEITFKGDDPGHSHIFTLLQENGTITVKDLDLNPLAQKRYATQRSFSNSQGRSRSASESPLREREPMPSPPIRPAPGETKANRARDSEQVTVIRTSEPQKPTVTRNDPQQASSDSDLHSECSIVSRSKLEDDEERSRRERRSECDKPGGMVESPNKMSSPEKREFEAFMSSSGAISGAEDDASRWCGSMQAPTFSPAFNAAFNAPSPLLILADDQDDAKTSSSLSRVERASRHRVMPGPFTPATTMVEPRKKELSDLSPRQVENALQHPEVPLPLEYQNQIIKPSRHRASGGEIVTLSLSPVTAGTRPGAYTYDGVRGYEIGSLALDENIIHDTLPLKAARFLLSPYGETRGCVSILRHGVTVAKGFEFNVSPDEKHGSLVWYESGFQEPFELEAGDLVLLEMAPDSAKCMFVFANTRAGYRDLSSGLRVRAVDGTEGRDNRFSMYAELLLDVEPKEANAFEAAAGRG